MVLRRRHLSNLYRLGLVGMLLVMLSVTWAQPKDPVIATVNGHNIRLSYVYGKIESLSLGEQIDVRAQLQSFTDSVIQEEILFQSMLRSNFLAEPELREQVKATVVEYLIQKYVQDRIVASEDAIQAYYQDNASTDLRRGCARAAHSTSTASGV
ncbi:MAG: hypothetical protein O7G88_06560 [bacterium]|nr:hypothetical protein [bacterium]